MTRKSKMSTGSSKLSLRRSKRLSKIQLIEIQNKHEDGTIEPVAASSPKNTQILDSEGEECINAARNNLESIKNEIIRQARLLRFKIGPEMLNQPFTKRFFAKNCYECHLKGSEKSNESTMKTLSGFCSLSSSNFASSTKYLNRNHDKKPPVKQNKKNEISRILTRRQSSKMESDFNNITFNIGKSKDIQPTRQKSKTISSTHTSQEQTPSCSNTSSKFKVPLASNRQVAIVTPCSQVNNSLSVFRKPLAGELAISLYGSPLLVAPDCAPTNMPQINLPTADGKVLSILPRNGFTVEDLPKISTPTRYQLRTLNKYLNVMCTKDD